MEVKWTSKELFNEKVGRDCFSAKCNFVLKCYKDYKLWEKAVWSCDTYRTWERLWEF